MRLLQWLGWQNQYPYNSSLSLKNIWQQMRMGSPWNRLGGVFQAGLLLFSWYTILVMLIANSRESQSGLLGLLELVLSVVVVLIPLCLRRFGDRAVLGEAIALIFLEILLILQKLKVAQTDVLVNPVVIIGLFCTLYLVDRYANPRLVFGWNLIAYLGTLSYLAVLQVAFAAGLVMLWLMIPLLLVLVFAGFWALIAPLRAQDQRINELKAQAELAALVERTAIAREMHDIIAHNLTGVIALADGARFAAKEDPQVAIATLATISATSRQALDQLRGLLQVLRTSDEARSELIPAQDLAGLVNDARRQGLTVTVAGLELIPQELPEFTMMTIYRLTSEMLTNMLKYAAGRQGSLVFELEQTGKRQELKITATNALGEKEEAERRKKPAAPTAGGFGIMGMKERAAALGGTVTVLRDEPADKFQISAQLPLPSQEKE